MDEAATARFDPEPACASEARRFVLARLQDWDLERFSDEAALCTAELATNAILHSRTPFTVAARPLPAGVRIDVQDEQPTRLPDPLPDDFGPLESGSTGRGLKLVAGMATRWGYFNTDVAKTVWAELADTRLAGPADPYVELTARSYPAGAPAVSLIDLPVRVSLASGAQVDDLVRQLQLAPGLLTDEEQGTFQQLLERSAAPRLTGRHEAFRAAGEGRDRYSLRLSISPEETAATSALTAMLASLVRRGLIEPMAVSAEVEAFRLWLAEEVAAQQGGRPPTPYRGRS